MWGQRNALPSPKPENVGSLHQELAAVAGIVQQRAYYGPVTVWVDDEAYVFAIDSLFAPILPEAWVVGTFNSSCGHGDIESDLRALLVERIQNAIFTEEGETA